MHSHNRLVTTDAKAACLLTGLGNGFVVRKYALEQFRINTRDFREHSRSRLPARVADSTPASHHASFINIETGVRVAGRKKAKMRDKEQDEPRTLHDELSARHPKSCRSHRASSEPARAHRHVNSRAA